MGSLTYHLVAFLVVAIWGSTFVFTKLLLQEGLSPAQIFTLRFLVSYVLLTGYDQLLTHRSSHSFRLSADSVKDELLLVTLGIAGGSVYFLAENTALLYTTATNTSLIVCSCPLFTMLLVALAYRHTERFSRTQMAGSLMACAGMAVVVLNGHFVLHLSPLGDLLAFAACLLWAVYSLVMKDLSQRYGSLFITRKVFIYGLLTMVPYYIACPEEVTLLPTQLSQLHAPHAVFLNLLYLTVVASMLCYLLWGWVIKRLGAVETTNWVYVNPLSTMLFAWWLLDEQITLWLLLGAVLILSGMYLCDRRP